MERFKLGDITVSAYWLRVYTSVSEDGETANYVAVNLAQTQDITCKTGSTDAVDGEKLVTTLSKLATILKE